jgi:hypothetical protein
LGDQQRTIVLAAGFACRNEDGGGHTFFVRSAQFCSGDYDNGLMACTLPEMRNILFTSGIV